MSSYRKVRCSQPCDARDDLGKEYDICFDPNTDFSAPIPGPPPPPWPCAFTGGIVVCDEDDT